MYVSWRSRDRRTYTYIYNYMWKFLFDSAQVVPMYCWCKIVFY